MHKSGHSKLPLMTWTWTHTHTHMHTLQPTQYIHVCLYKCKQTELCQLSVAEPGAPGLCSLIFLPTCPSNSSFLPESVYFIQCRLVNALWSASCTYHATAAPKALPAGSNCRLWSCVNISYMQYSCSTRATVCLKTVNVQHNVFAWFRQRLSSSGF